MGYISLDAQISRAIAQQIDALTPYPAFRHLEGKKSAFTKKYLTLAKKRIRELTGKKRIRNDYDTRNIQYYHNYDTEQTLRPFYVYMTKLLHKHVFGKVPTEAQMKNYQSHRIVHNVYGFWPKKYTRRPSTNFELGFTLLPRAFDKIRVTHPKLFKTKVAIWEKKALNNLPRDSVTYENFKNGDKAVYLGHGHYVSPNTFRRLNKKSRTAEEVYEAYNNIPDNSPSGIRVINPYTTKEVNRRNMQFVTLYKKTAPNKTSTSSKNQRNKTSTSTSSKNQRNKTSTSTSSNNRRNKTSTSTSSNNRRNKILKALQARGL